MGRTLRLSEGRFGRLVLSELEAQERVEAQGDPAIVLQSRYDGVLFLNPGEAHVTPGPTRVLAFHTARGWLRAGFPAAFEDDESRPFSQPVEAITPRIPRHAVRRDRDLAPRLRARQDRRGGGRARLLRAEQLHALLPEPSRRAALRIPARDHPAARRARPRSYAQSRAVALLPGAPK